VAEETIVPASLDKSEEALGPEKAELSGQKGT